LYKTCTPQEPKSVTLSDLERPNDGHNYICVILWQLSETPASNSLKLSHWHCEQQKCRPGHSRIRPPDLVGRLTFSRDSFFLYLFCHPQSSRNGIQPKLVTCSDVSAIWKCMS